VQAWSRPLEVGGLIRLRQERRAANASDEAGRQTADADAVSCRSCRRAERRIGRRFASRERGAEFIGATLRWTGRERAVRGDDAHVGPFGELEETEASGKSARAGGRVGTKGEPAGSNDVWSVRA
jgi:hypothetical protein